jgi:hypothetical protein
MRCNEVVELVNLTTSVIRGNLLVHKGKCPNCHCTSNRGGRLPNQPIITIKREETIGQSEQFSSCSGIPYIPPPDKKQKSKIG